MSPRIGLLGRLLGDLPDGVIRTFSAEALALVEVGSRSDGDPVLHVIVAWIGDDSPATLQAIRGWREKHSPGSALLGYAPVGDQALAETALEIGFDDIMVQGSVRELACRAKALHRRFTQARQRRGVLRLGPLRLEGDQSTVYVGGERHLLTKIETRLLAALMRAGGNTLTRDELLAAAWGDDGLETSERAVDNSILRLRRKLALPNLIATVRGIGFRLKLD